MARLTTFPGTRRTRDPAETLERVTRRLGDYGITRLADVTGLDVIGIPVVMSVRPLATTLSVSQGKGADLTSARVSAAMEAVELWHAEQAVPKPEHQAVPARDLDLPYEVTDLEQVEGSLLTDRTRLDWIGAEVLTGGEALVPRESVRLDMTGTAWRGHHLSASSNGLASGNTVAEATVHALYEQIERDCTSAAARARGARAVVAPETVTDPHCAELIARIRAAGGRLDIVDASRERWRPVTCFFCHLRMPDMGTVVGGSGAHRDPAIALSRAITEAAQSRLTFIVGTRDDINPHVYGLGATEQAVLSAETVPWAAVAGGADAPSATDDEELDRLAALVASVTGSAPMRVDLTAPEEAEDFAVVKTLSPGLEFLARHELPGPE